MIPDATWYTRSRRRRPVQDGIYIRKIVEREMSDTKDSDGDGMPDKYEYEHRLDPYSDDSSYDKDGDGYSNIEEFRAGTKPDDPDDFPQKNEPDYTNVYLAIIIIVVIVILIILILSSRKPTLKTAKTQKKPVTEKQSIQRRSKRRGMKPLKEDEMDRSTLQRELKEKRTALRLLREEFKSKNIMKKDYTKMKKEYENTINSIEMKLR